MGEIYLSKDIVLPSEEDKDSIFFGKIKLEDIRSKSLTRQLEQECNSLLKQSFVKEPESKIELDDVLDSINVLEYKSDRWFFSKWLEIGEAFWKRVLKLLSFVNEAFGLNLDLKLTDKLILTKEKQKRKNLLFSFLDAIRKKFFKKELTLEEMIELQIKVLEEQLATSKNDLEVIHQIKKQLEFLMKLKAKLFELSLEQELNKTTEWLFTIGAMQTVAEMARGLYKSKEMVATKEQWQKVENLLNSDRSSRKVSNTICDNRGVESVKTKPFISNDQNNNFSLTPISQNVTKDSNSFLKLLYTLLLLANTYVMKHIGLGIGSDSEVKIYKSSQEGLTINKVGYQKRATMIQSKTVELQGGQVFFNINKSQNAKLQRETSTTRSDNIPNSELKEPKIQVINNSKACVER